MSAQQTLDRALRRTNMVSPRGYDRWSLHSRDCGYISGLKLAPFDFVVSESLPIILPSCVDELLQRGVTSALPAERPRRVRRIPGGPMEGGHCFDPHGIAQPQRGR